MPRILSLQPFGQACLVAALLFWAAMANAQSNPVGPWRNTGDNAGALGADAATPATNATAGADDARRAQALLQRAVAHYKYIKEPALADFSRKAEFVDGELYVYVVSTAGVLLASGGPSSSVIGRNVADQQDALGKPFFREMLDKARTNESGTVEYRWLNPVDNKVERKVAYFQKVGDRIIAVGYYVARATPAQAQALLARAVDAVRADTGKAIDAFNTPRGPYAEDDLYVFVVDLSDKRFRAHGVDRRLIGTDALSLRDPNGKPIAQEMIAAVAERDQVELDYAWPNPVTGKVENKHTFLRKVGDLLVGVGYYTR
jgi:cytochrome c